MGLGRKACKAQWVILKIDSSVQPESDWEGYVESLYADRDKLVTDPTDPPAEFSLRQLTAPQKSAIEAMPTQRETAMLAIRCALIGLKHYTVLNADGTEEILSAVVTQRVGKLGDIATAQWAEQTFNPTAEQIVQLYEVISTLSEASLPLSKPSAPECGPPKSESPESSVE